MRKRSLNTLIAGLLAWLLAIAVSSPMPAQAASVDISVNGTFGQETFSGVWDWCTGSSCNKTAYVKIKNLGGVATYAHVHIGTWEAVCADSDTPFNTSVVVAYKVNCSTGAVIGSALGEADVGGTYVDLAGATLPGAVRFELINMGVGAEVCLSVSYGYSTPPGHAGYRIDSTHGCPYEIEATVKSGDTDVDDTEHYNPYVHHGRTISYEMNPN